MRPSFLDNMSWAMAEVYGSVTDRLLVNLARHFPYIPYRRPEAYTRHKDRQLPFL